MSDRTFNILTQLSLNSDDFKNSINSVKQNVKDLMLGVEGANGNLGEMRRALMALKNTSFAGKSVEEIGAINEQIGKLMYEMKILKLEQKAMGEEFGVLAIQGLRGMTAVGEVALGAASMFGASKESAEEFKKSMIGVISVVHGLSEVQKMLEERTLQVIATRIEDTIMTVANSVSKTLNALVTGTQVVVTEALVVAETEQVVATEAATVATAELNSIMLLNPYVLITAAVIAATAALWYLVSAHREEREEVEKKEMAIKNLTAAIEIETIEDKNQLDLMKARGATELEILKTKTDNIEKLVEQKNAELALQQSLKSTEENNKEITKIERELLKLNGELKVSKIELAAKTYEENYTYKGLTEELTKYEEKAKNELLLSGKISAATREEIEALLNKKSAIDNAMPKEEKEKKTFSLNDDKNYYTALKNLDEEYSKSKTMNEKEYNLKKLSLEADSLKIASENNKYDAKEKLKIQFELEGKLHEIVMSQKGDIKELDAFKQQSTIYEEELEKQVATTKEQASIAEINKWKSKELEKLKTSKYTAEQIIVLTKQINDLEEAKKTTSKVNIDTTKADEEIQFQKILGQQKLKLDKLYYDSGKMLFKTYQNDKLESFKKDQDDETKLLENKIKRENLLDKDADKLRKDLEKKQINDKKIFTEEEKQIEKNKRDAVLGIISSEFGQAAGLFAQNTIAYKVMASAQAGISTYLAAENSYAVGSEIGGPILGGIFAGLAVAAGLENIAKINSFEYGGIVPGSNYSGDNVPIMANSGEMILNGSQQSNLFSMLNKGSNVGGSKEVVFKIAGTQLVGVLNNHNKKLSYTR